MLVLAGYFGRSISVSSFAHQIWILLQVNEALQDKNDKTDMSNPKRSAGFLSNRRSFTTTNNSNAQRKTRTGWNSEPNETYVAPGRNDRSSTTQYGSNKNNGYNRFMSKEPVDSVPMGHHSEFGSNLATRRFESKKLKNDREFAINTYVSNTPVPLPATTNNTQSDVVSNNHRTFENSTNSSHGEYMEDYDTIIPSSPYGSEVIDENMWLDVVPGTEFEFSTDLEASKVDYNNEIDDLNAEQLENDLTVLERVAEEDINRNVNNTDNHNDGEPQPEVAPIAEENQTTKFDLDEFFKNQLSMKGTESPAYPERGGIAQSRLQRLFKANDEHKQMGAEFDRYLQSFEFDPETNDLHRFTEPSASRLDMPTNAMNLMREKTFLPVNTPLNRQPQTAQQPQPTHRSRFAHIFNSDINQNNISKISLEQNKMGPLTVKPVVDNAAVFSVTDLEADISPVATTNSASFANTSSKANQPQVISQHYDLRLAQERRNVISANELEKDIEASTSPDNDLSAFTSLLDKMAAQKVPSGLHANSSQSSNRPQVFVNNTAPRIYSPGPDIIQTSVGMETHFLNERNQDNINASKKMLSGARPDGNSRVEPVNHRNMLFSQVAKQNGDGSSVNKTQQQLPMVSGVSGIDPRNISPIPTPMGQNMNVNALMQNLQQQQQKAALSNIPSSGATSQNLLNLPPNLILFQQQLALQQQQQKLKQQQQIKPGSIPSNVIASAAAGKRQTGNQEMFTPTAVMRNLSLTENPVNSFSSGSISSASSQQTFSNSQKSINSILNQATQSFSGNALQTNQLLLQSALINNLKVGGSTTSTPALRTQISAGIQGVPNVVNAVSSANQNNTKMVSAGQTSDINLMTSSSGASTQGGGNSNPVSNVTPVIGAPIINPFLFNPLMRAPPSLVLPSPNNSLNNVQQLQQMLFRQQFANNVLLRAQLMRQLNANAAGGAAIPNNNLPGTGAPNVGSGGSRNPNVSPQNLPLSTATIDALLASGDSLFSNTVNGPANSSLNAANLSASQLNKTVGAPTQVQDMQNMKLPPGLNVKDNPGPS